MKVKMKFQITGTRDGVRWPAPGGVVDLPDAEAAKLCASGAAVPVQVRGPEEAVASGPEAAVVPKRSSRRGQV